MRRKRIGWAIMAVLALGAAASALGQQDEAPLPKLKTKSASGTILVVCDLACNWTLDGKAMGSLAGGENKIAPVSLGRHAVGAVADGSPDKVRLEVTVRSAAQTAVQLELQPVRDARLKAEQEAAAARQQAQEAAAQKQREADAAAEVERQAEALRRMENQGAAFYNRGDYAAARPLFEQACDRGNMDGCAYLGWIYQNSLGVTQDYFQARKYYQQACDGKNMDGCRNLGVLYEYGWGATVDYEQARNLYRTACDGGNRAGCGNLGYLYWKGHGVAQDVAKGRELMQVGCNAGVQSYCDWLKQQP